MKFLKIIFIVQSLGKKPLCNGKAERALRIGEFVFLLCYRCMTMVLGLLVGLIVLIMLKQEIKDKAVWFLNAFLLVIPTFIDGLLQYISIIESNNLRRSITGLIAGIGLAMIGYSIYLIIYDKIIKESEN